MKDVIAYQPELDAIDWRTSLRRTRAAVTRHWILILTSCAVSLVIVALYVRIFPPVYKAEAVLMGEANDDVIRGNYYENWNVFRKWDIKAEPELIRSGRVSRQVVEALDLKFTDVHHTFFTHLGWLWTESFVGRNYRKLKEWLFPPDPSAFKATPEQVERGRTIDAFRDGVAVDVVPGTTIGRVIVRAPSWRAAEIANKVVEVYLAERRKILRAEADEAYNALSIEVKSAAAALEALDREKLEFDSKNKVILGFERDRLEVANWATLQLSVKELTGTIASLEAGLAAVERQLLREPPEIVSGRTLQDSKAKVLLQTREVDLSNNLLASSQRYAPTSPEVTDAARLLAETRSRLAAEPDKVVVNEDRTVNPLHQELRQKQLDLRGKLESARATLAAKQAPLAEYERRMARVPALSKAVTEQARLRETLEMRHKLLVQRMMQAEVSRTAITSAPPSVRVIDLAVPPMKPDWPRNIIIYPGALAAGLVVGLVLAVLAELFSPQVNRDRLVSHPEIPVYAVIDLPAAGAAALPPGSPGDPRGALRRLRSPG